MSSSRPSPATLGRFLPGVAFAVGAVRAWTKPLISDGAFLLVRAGGAWVTGHPQRLAEPPGSHDAPFLGAIVTALGSIFSPDQETITRPAAALLYGTAAALLTHFLRRRVDLASTILGMALFLIPPAFGTAFALRPDAALGGVLLLAALGRTLEVGRRPGGVATAAVAALATPAALPAALALALWPDRRKEAVGGPRAWAGLLPAAGILALAAAIVPAAGRGSLLSGLLAGWGAPFAGIASTGGALRDVWALGLLFLAPLLGPVLVRRARLPAVVQVAWSAAAATALLFCGEGAFREHSAALLPVACLLVVLRVAAIPDPQAGPGTPRRPVMIAFLLPLALAMLGPGADERGRFEARAEASRLSQIGAVLEGEDPPLPDGSLLARRTGALAAHSNRAVEPLTRAAAVLSATSSARPAAVVLGGGLFPDAGIEWHLLDDSRFWAGWAPVPIRRGRQREQTDWVWRRRERPAAGVTADYARAQREALRAQLDGRMEDARRALERAVASEPEPLGLAREELGILEARHGDPLQALELFEAARRDPAAVRARIRLADRALSHEDARAADSLLAAVESWSPSAPTLHAVRARREALRGSFAAAIRESEEAALLAPGDPRVLINHGVLLWRGGRPDSARLVWDRAIAVEPRAVRFLGDYRGAPDDSTPPPLLALFGPLGVPEVEAGRPGRSR